jgi:hypothetical protein
MSNTNQSIRIRLRSDTQQAWENAQQGTDAKGNLASGEIGLKIDENTDGVIFVKGYVGVNTSPTPIDECPVIFNAELVDNPDYDVALLNEKKFSTIPVIYEKPTQEILDNTLITWNADDEKWEVNTVPITLSELPTQNGTVVYDSASGSFMIGEVISVTDIDGGTYGETDV